MAFNISERFKPSSPSYRFFEPGAYQTISDYKNKPNKAPFQSKAKRKTHSANQLWTHAMYQTNLPIKVPNCTSLISKCPRFPYEALSKEDLDELLCKCGVQKVCGCSDENEDEAEIICQARVGRRLYKGPPPRSEYTGGLSAPSRRDHGYAEFPDGTYRRIFYVESKWSPPFYNTHVQESTAFYRGCKWSSWKGLRTLNLNEERPGPADYTISGQTNSLKICDEKVREEKRKTSKQLRFIEYIQQKEISKAYPGPASYNPQFPNGMKLSHLGPKADRFKEHTYEQHPGPCEYSIRREFDSPAPVINSCLARLPEPSFFGVKAKRFRNIQQDGPSPASYSPSDKLCNITHCSIAPFASSSARFKNIVSNEFCKNELVTCNDDKTRDNCPTATWQFTSKTKRMQPLHKKLFEQSPADLPMKNTHLERTKQLQYTAPFYTSEGRFQPWYNWIPVLGKFKTPGPGYYNHVKSRCLPAVCQGPLFRAKRFPAKVSHTPGPNEYKVKGGIESILKTHNHRLKKNIKNKHTFIWKSPIETNQLPLEVQENILIHKSIALLNIDGDSETKQVSSIKKETTTDKLKKPKLLRCFLYSNPVPQYF